MTKRLIAVLLTLVLLAGLAAADELPDFASLTGLDRLSRKLDSGVTITHVYYTEGYGFSDSKFTTWDAAEIASLLYALNQIGIVGEVNQDITDWYPQIIFYLSDGTSHSISFDGRWLEINGRTHYELTNAATFWQLTAYYVSLHSGDEPAEPDPEPAGEANSFEMYLPLATNGDCYWDSWATAEDIVSVMDMIDDDGDEGDNSALQWVLIQGVSSGSTTLTFDYIEGDQQTGKTLILELTVDEDLNVLVRSMNLVEDMDGIKGPEGEITDFWLSDDDLPYGTPSAVYPAYAKSKSVTNIEERLTSFMYFWSANDLENMLNCCAPSWARDVYDTKPINKLYQILSLRVPILDTFQIYKVSGSDSDVSATVTMTVSISRNMTLTPVTYLFNVLMLKEDGIWYVDPRSLQSNEEPTPYIYPTQPPQPVSSADPNTVLYYNPDGGKFYHLDPMCKSANVRYLPFKGKLTYSQLNEEPYSALFPCAYCNAPLRPDN